MSSRRPRYSTIWRRLNELREPIALHKRREELKSNTCDESRESSKLCIYRALKTERLVFGQAYSARNLAYSSQVPLYMLTTVKSCEKTSKDLKSAPTRIGRKETPCRDHASPP